MEKVKKPFYKKWWFIAIVVLIVIGGIGNALESDETKQKREDEKVAAEQKIVDDKAKKIEVAAIKEKETKEKDAADKAKAKEKEASMTPEEKVVKIITDKIGKNNNMDKDRIVESKVFEPGDGTRNIILTMNASENLTNKLTKKTMWMDSVAILEPLSKIEGVQNISVEWLYPLIDQYGNTEDGRIMMFDFTKETFDKVNWDNFNNENLPNVSTGYFEHPTLSK